METNVWEKSEEGLFATFRCYFLLLFYLEMWFPKTSQDAAYWYINEKFSRYNSWLSVDVRYASERVQ